MEKSTARFCVVKPIELYTWNRKTGRGQYVVQCGYGKESPGRQEESRKKQMDKLNMP
jgi:hypothetical protein